LQPDFSGPFDYVHRRTESADIYFLAGQGTANCTFRIRGKMPELWDAVTGRIVDAVCCREISDGRTVVPVTLPVHGSLFVVFRKPLAPDHFTSVAGPQDGLELVAYRGDRRSIRFWKEGTYVFEAAGGERRTVSVSKLPPALTLSGPWNVHFAEGWGVSEPVVFDRLIPWNQHSMDGVKYFSGTAVYRKTFKLTTEQAAGAVRLQLGEVHCVAEVKVNGRSLGVVWTAPWTADLSGGVKVGENELEIAVTNTWQNRLIGDAGLPNEKQLTRTNVRCPLDYRQTAPGRRILRGYWPQDPLASAGLLGPVQLEFGRDAAPVNAF
jgi:hypothetical protein